LEAASVDRITIGSIFAYGRIGADPGERDEPQRLEVEVNLDLDLSAAARSDDVADTVDYAAVHAGVVNLIQTTSYALLERLASAMLEGIFADHRIARAIVKISKPQILAGATPSVELVRDNPNYRAAT
jgi:dihydroneopterin aldolase